MSVIFVSDRFINEEGDPYVSYFHAKASASRGEDIYLFNLGAPLPKIDDDLYVAFSGFPDFCCWRPLRYFLSSFCLLIHLFMRPYDKVVFFFPGYSYRWTIRFFNSFSFIFRVLSLRFFPY